jgi:predicted HicB family RNase H-like nuclease
MKHTLNLYIEDELIEEIKLQAVREKRSVSEIVEQLIEGYLKSSKKKGKGKS